MKPAIIFLGMSVLILGSYVVYAITTLNEMDAAESVVCPVVEKPTLDLADVRARAASADDVLLLGMIDRLLPANQMMATNYAQYCGPTLHEVHKAACAAFDKHGGWPCSDKPNEYGR